MSTRSGRIRQSLIEASPPRTRKGVSPTRSPGRTRKTSPTARSAQKSPSRKSPSRKPAPKYPARKSPSRAVKENKEEKVSPAKRPTIRQNAEVKLLNISSKLEILKATRTRRSEYISDDAASSVSSADPLLTDKLNGLDNVSSLPDLYELRNRRVSEDSGRRRSSRFKDVIDNVADINRSLSKSHSKSMSKSVGNYSDEDGPEEPIKEKSHSVTRKLSTPLPSSTTLSQINDKYDFMGLIGSCSLYFLIPITVFYILISCHNSCSLKSFHEIYPYKSPLLWFSLPTTVLVIAQYVLQAVLASSRMFGITEIDKQGKKFCFNALFATISSIIILFALFYYNIIDRNIILRSYLQMASTSYLIGVFLATVLYFKSFNNQDNLNTYGNSGHFLYDFFMGRKIHDRFGKINIKLWLARTSNITALILTIIMFEHGFKIQGHINDIEWESLKGISDTVQLKPTVLIYAGMQMIYILYFIMKEKQITTTFYWHSEGLGYLQTVSSTLYPFLFTTISKYIMDTGLSMPYYLLVTATIVYSMGFLLLLTSNNIKHELRENPLQPKVINLESMPTFHGKKLLMTHMWGRLRHPNYTGDILMHTALALPGILSRQILACAPALITMLVLIHRSWRDHKRCRKRYGAAWHRYCMKVPSILIPKIF